MHCTTCQKPNRQTWTQLLIAWSQFRQLQVPLSAHNAPLPSAQTACKALAIPYIPSVTLQTQRMLLKLGSYPVDGLVLCALPSTCRCLQILGQRYCARQSVRDCPERVRSWRCVVFHDLTFKAEITNLKLISTWISLTLYIHALDYCLA